LGYKLRRWLADHLPPGISSGERLVALEAADQANDDTRTAYGTDLLEIIARRSGLSGPKQVGKILGKLAAHGIELRVPVTGADGRPLRDGRGRPVFACNGHKLTLRIPTLEDCPALVAPEETIEGPPPGAPSTFEGPPSGAPSTAEGPPPGTGRSPAGDSKVPRPGHPSPHISSGVSSPPSIPPRDLTAQQGKGEGETPEEDVVDLALVRQVRELRPEWSTRAIIAALTHPAVLERPALLRAAAMIAVARDAETRHPGRLAADGPWWQQAARSHATRPPAARCGRCNPYRRLEDEHGNDLGPCPSCFPAARPAPGTPPEQPEPTQRPPRRAFAEDHAAELAAARTRMAAASNKYRLKARIP